MAVFHLTTKPISRKSGRTATAAAAYRAAALIQCEYTGLTHDYRNKRGVDYTECVIVDAQGNPTFLDREQLWNAAELAEKRKDARTAREIIVALPHELDAEGRKFAARAFGGRLSQLYGVAVDVCIHQPDKDGDERNYHAHIMMTTRKVTVENGKAILGDKSDLELSDRELRKRYGSDASGRKFINEIRKRWADGVNSILEKKGIDARIDHRSHRDRGLDIAPTVKMGVSATAMERKGIRTEKGDINRAIKRANAELLELQTELEWVYDDAVDADLLNEIHPSALAPAKPTKPPATAMDAPPAPAPKWAKPATATSRRQARTIVVDDDFVPPPAPKVVESVRDGWQEYSAGYALHGAFSPRYNGNPLSNEMLALELKKQAGMSQDDYQHQRKVFETVAIDNAKRLVSNQGKYNEHEYKERERTAMLLLDTLTNQSMPAPAKTDEQKAEAVKTARDDDFDFSL